MSSTSDVKAVDSFPSQAKDRKDMRYPAVYIFSPHREQRISFSRLTPFCSLQNIAGQIALGNASRDGQWREEISGQKRPKSNEAAPKKPY